MGLMLGGSGAIYAETTVKLTEMHICCGGCTKGIQNAVKDLTDAKVAVDQANGESTITAATPEAAQKAVDAIVAAGYHAKVEGTGISIKDDSGAPSGKVKRLTVSNAHNCCGACTKAIKAAIKEVPGVEADTAKPKTKDFVIEGNFDAKAVVAALYEAGFHVTVK
ncbi:MAG: cation transporter [Planctomycetia bacterium]|nr:cation transporter [Planctomycetia bacterium]